MTETAHASGKELYPDVLKSREWWVNWVLAVRRDEMANGAPAPDATPTKQPVAPYDRGDAEPTRWNHGLSEEEHPSTSFEEASKWDRWSIGGADLPAPDRVLSDELGIGIIIPVGGGAGRSILLLDWDDVRDPETGEVHPLCAWALRELGGYAEISQSGKGIHQFVFGEIPGGLKKYLRHIDEEPFIGDEKPMVEMYSSGRLTAMTGRHVEGTGEDVVDGQDVVDEIVWRTGTNSNNSTETPTDPFADRRDEGESERPSHEEIGETLQSQIEFDGEDPSEWSVGPEESIKYAAVLKGRERSDELPNTANWELIGYAAAIGKTIGKSKAEVRADLEDHKTPQYGYDADRARNEIRSVWTKVENGHMDPPSVETLKKRGLLPEDYVEISELHTDSTLTPAQCWEAWGDARKRGDLGEESIVPTAALRHVAREQVGYPVDELPDDRDDLPAVPNNKALAWVENTWPEKAGISLDDDEDVTRRTYKSYDPTDVYTWEDVRTIYDRVGSKEGRYAAVSLLRDRYKFLTPADTDELHVYDPDTGIFDSDLRRDIGLELDRELGQYCTGHERREIISRLKLEVVDRDELEAADVPGTYVCVKNGVLDISEPGKRELLPPDPKYKFTKRLPWAYDPDAEMPKIDEFLEEITKQEADKKTLLEMVGHALLPNYKYEKALILFGDGSNGKSTWFEIVNTFLGEENTASIGLKKLTENRFAASNLVGKWANVGADLPDKKIHELGKFKELTGGDRTFVEAKNEDGYEFRNRATLMFAANDPPVLGERGYQIQRRLVPVHLPYRFTTEDDDHKDAKKGGFEAALTEPEELQGLLNAALDGLDRLRKTGDVSLPESHEERLERYERHSDHIKAFRIDGLTNASGERIEKDTVYAAYTNYCKSQGHDPVNKKTFWKQLRKTTLDVSTVRPPERSDGTRPRMLDNAAFTDDGEEYAPDYAIEDSESEQDTETEDVDATPIDAVTPGDMTTVTAEVVQTYSDPKNWLEKEGFIVDRSGAIKFNIREACDVELEEGGYYRFEEVSIKRESDGMVAIEVIPNLSTVTPIDPGEGHTRTESQVGAFSSADHATATDGGGAPPSGAELEGNKALIQETLRHLNDENRLPMSRPKSRR